MKERNRNIGIIVMVIIASIAYGLFCCWRCSYVAIDSDYANLVLEGKDLISGNFLRNGWNLTGISFLTTDLVYFCIGVLIAGVSKEAYFIACALMQVGLVLTGLLLVKKELEENYRVLKALIYFSIAMLPCTFAISILRAHTGVFILCFVAMFLFDRLISENYRQLEVIFLIFIIAAGVVGDPIILVLLVCPICIWGVISWTRGEQSGKKIAYIVAICTLGTGIGTIVDKIYFKLGGANKNDFLGSKMFISIEELSDKFIVYFKSLLYMMDANFESKALLGMRTPIYALNTIIILIVLFIIVYNIVTCICGRDYDLITVVLGLGFILMSVLFVLSSISVDVNSSRYIGYFVVLAPIILIRNIRLFRIESNNKLQRLLYILMIGILFGKIYTLKNDVKSEAVVQQNLANVLKENNLTTGYASFWNASSITVLSEEELKVRSVIAGNGKIEMHNWFCKDEWYKDYANFIIVADNDLFGITGENARICFGEPAKIVDTLGFQIFVYDKDISSYLTDWVTEIKKSGGSLRGVYGYETEYAWSQQYCEIKILNSEVEDDLEFVFSVPSTLFISNNNAVEVKININGVVAFEQKYVEAAEEKIVISKQELSRLLENNVYNMEVFCSKFFVPLELGINEDARELALQLRYVGPVR